MKVHYKALSDVIDISTFFPLTAVACSAQILDDFFRSWQKKVVDKGLGKMGRLVGLVLLLLTTKATPLTVCGVGFETTEAVHMSAYHHRWLDHQFEANGAFEQCLIYDGA